MLPTLVLQLNKVRPWVLKTLMAILSKLCQEVMCNSGKSFLLTEISFLDRSKCIRLTTEEKNKNME